MDSTHTQSGTTHRSRSAGYRVPKLTEENRTYAGTGGISAGNRNSGFIPAFLDAAAGVVYLSRHANGQLAPFHTLDGFPDEVVRDRTANGHVTALNISIESGFVLDGRFYTRAQAAALVQCH